MVFDGAMGTEIYRRHVFTNRCFDELSLSDPEHIREVVKGIKPLVRARAKRVILEPAPAVQPKEPTPFAQKSRLAWRLAHRQWVTTVELLPPRGYDLSETIAKSKRLHRHGVDAINIPDGPRASSRISPLVTAARIQQEALVGVILHLCCRDRNALFMKNEVPGVIVPDAVLEES